MRTFRKGKRKLKTRIKKGGDILTQMARKRGLYKGMSTSEIASKIKAIDDATKDKEQKKISIEKLLYEYSTDPDFGSLYSNIIRDVKSKKCSEDAQKYVKTFDLDNYKKESALTEDQKLAREEARKAQQEISATAWQHDRF